MPSIDRPRRVALAGVALSLSDKSDMKYCLE